MKKLTLLVVIILVTGLLAGCNPFSTFRAEIVGDTIYLGDPDNPATHQLEMTYGGTDVTLSCDYSSNNTDAATVSADGLIAGVAAGNAIVHVTYGLWHTCDIHVVCN